jgi:hypothetical protein
MSKDIKRISEIEINNGYLSFKCSSELYGVTDAGGTVEQALESGFVSLGDGCDYKLTSFDRDIIRTKLSQI